MEFVNWFCCCVWCLGHMHLCDICVKVSNVVWTIIKIFRWSFSSLLTTLFVNGWVSSTMTEFFLLQLMISKNCKKYVFKRKERRNIDFHVKLDITLKSQSKNLSFPEKRKHSQRMEWSGVKKRRRKMKGKFLLNDQTTRWSRIRLAIWKERLWTWNSCLVHFIVAIAALSRCRNKDTRLDSPLNSENFLFFFLQMYAMWIFVMAFILKNI
jgi:hypothetical protein